MTATTALRSEHDHILAMIACLVSACKAAENVDRLDSDTFRAGLDFIQNYADAWHHAKEEDLLFPALEAAGMPRGGGPIAVMLNEHELGRTYVRQIGKNLEAAINGDNSALQLVLRFTLAYADLLTQHIQKENNILFNMADQILSPAEQARLQQEYKTVIPASASAKSGEYYEGIVAKLCERWNVDPQDVA
jgi:hemerythrin-like domain-containing protein